MEFTGSLVGIARDWKTGRVHITFAINEESILRKIDELKDCKLAITAKKFRKKRSLDANAYLWVLCTKIAEKVYSSKDEIYEEMIQKYGCLYQDEDGYMVMTIKSDKDISKVQGHWRPYKNNGRFASYLMIKGSSDYDTKEMAHFIDMVVLEAQELDIETLPPNELDKLKEMWGVENG